jgi:hypothetical protein
MLLLGYELLTWIKMTTYAGTDAAAFLKEREVETKGIIQSGQ